MSKFNSTKKPAVQRTIVNLAGGSAYSETDKLHLASILLTSFMGDQYYSSADETRNRLIGLIPKAGPEFAAKAAVFARREFGLRSVTHVVAAEIARLVKGESWTRDFLRAVIRRPDDILEILSYYIAIHKKPIPNCMKKGLGSALSSLNEYSLAKYKSGAKELSMVDAVNLLHPKHTPGIEKLIKGTLPAAETWETKLTQAGQAAETEDDLVGLKADAWTKLVTEGKLKYFALLRNLRNLRDNVSPETLDVALAQLRVAENIKKSLVLPFRYMTALAQFSKEDEPEKTSVNQKISNAIMDAAEIAMDNVPKFKGHTAVVVDVSGSMGCSGRGWGSTRTEWGAPIDKAAVMAAALAKASEEVTVILFADNARVLPITQRDSLLSITKKLRDNGDGGGTNMPAVFNVLPACDRVVILSDMQTWMDNSFSIYNQATRTAAQVFKEWKKAHPGSNPKIFTVDVQGYGTLQFPEKDIYCLAGFSDRLFDIFKMLEEDKDALIHRIEAVSFTEPISK